MRWGQVILELALLTTGILIALAVDGWMDDRRDMRTERNYLELLVRDLDRSLAFYSDFLGFRNAQVTQSSPQSYSYPVFRLPAQAKLRFCTLDSATEVRALALTEVTGIDLPAPGPIVTSTPVIRVEDFDEVHARLRAAGLDVVEPRRSKTVEGHDFRELAFTDPDGHLVVLYELD